MTLNESVEGGVRLFPAQQATLDAALAQSLAQVEDGKAKDRGLALGDQVAAQIVALRANDGSDAAMVYTPPVGLGFWQPDPRTGPSPFLFLGICDTVDNDGRWAISARAPAQHL